MAEREFTEHFEKFVRDICKSLHGPKNLPRDVLAEERIEYHHDRRLTIFYHWKSGLVDLVYVSAPGHEMRRYKDEEPVH